METILGINCFKHDAAAAILVDGEPAAAAEEERFNRVKHTGDFPARAIRFCLETAGLDPERLDHVAFYMRPGRVLAENLTYWPLQALKGRSPGASLRFLGSQLMAAERMRSVPGRIRDLLGHSMDGTAFHFVEHHPAHAASAFFASGFESAAVLTLDGVGERDTATMGTYDPEGYRIHRRSRFPHSPGFFYSAITRYLGFKPDSDEYKVMGLASYGTPAHVDLFRRIIRTRDQGAFSVDTSFFAFHENPRGTLFGPRLAEVLGPPRRPGEKMEDRHADIASSAQLALEEATLELAREIRRETGEERLVLAGGVALNCVMNGRILREAGFSEIYPFPAAHDAGTSLGAAWHVDRIQLGHIRTPHTLPHVFWGPSFSESEIEAELRGNRIVYTRPEVLTGLVAKLIDNGLVVGWFQGAAEFGPRALGNRSILADPRRAEMQEKVNTCVKRRESFRPFAPSVLEEHAADYFEGCRRSPHMNLVFHVRESKRDVIPAVTHVDGTARVHTVSPDFNPLYHRLIGDFHRRTGVPVVLNTSFNVRGEPIVTTPREAVRTFFGSGMDALAMGPFLVLKPGQLNS